jgi:hypothetical protein
MATLPVAAVVAHVPPAGVEFNVAVNPIHTGVFPVIVVGLGLIVAIAVMIQPVLNV